MWRPRQRRTRTGRRGPRRAPFAALRTLAGLAVAGLLLVPASAAAVLLHFETPISGDVVPVTAELTDLADAQGVAIRLAIPAGEGDLLGLFGNVADESLVPALQPGDPEGILTQWQFRTDAVWKVGGGNAIAPVKGWDWGLKIGPTGSAGGARVEEAYFELRATDLTVEEILSAVNQGWVLAVRIQSTNGAEGSSKLGLGADAPRLRIAEPADGALLGATPTGVRGPLYGVGVSVDVNGVAAVGGSGAFSADVPLDEGANTLVATGTNAVGSATDRVEVVLDTTPPEVEITTPAPGAVTEAGEIAVEGTVSDASPITAFTVNGSAVALEGEAFTTTVPLALGENEIEAVAVDAAGNSGSDALVVTRGEPPTVSLETPPDGTLLASRTVVATGSVTGLPTPEVRVNGEPATVDGGAFEVALSLAEGANALAATATNALGEASDGASVTVDTTPPSVTIRSPADGSLTTASEVTASGVASDGSPIAELTLNGVPTALDGGTFSGPVSLSLGENAITAVAVDAAGNEGSDAVTVTRGEAPTVTIGSPAAGATVDSTPISVTGTATGTPPLTVSVAGEPAVVEGGSYSASVPLEEGSNLLTATATNAFGEASAAVTVALETGPPLTVAIQSPPDGARVSSEVITVGGTVSDSAASVVLNGVSATVREGRWSAAAVRLDGEGEHPLTATALREGESASDSSTVVFRRPPEIAITEPAEGAILREAEVPVRGFVDDPTAFVDVNGVDASVGSGGRFTAEAVPLDPGPNRLAARAVDPRGATGRDEVEVTRDDAAAGRLRVVMLDPRVPFELDPFESPFTPIVAESLEEFRSELEALGFPPQGYDAPVEDATVPFQIWVYVFSELGAPGESVTLEVPEVDVSLSGSLQAIGELEADLGENHFDPALVPELVPDDFEPRSFESFEVEFGTPVVL